MSDGYTVFDSDPRVLRWTDAAARAAARLDTTDRRHGGTWFVGVDALPNDPTGAIDGTPLAGPWPIRLTDLHRAQVSIVYPGYPRQDPDESDAAHRYRRDRDAAHLDGLLPEGPEKRRHLREPHAWILGLPLDDTAASPLVVWPGSQRIIRAAFEQLYAGQPPDRWGEIDATDAYTAARRAVFQTCTRTELPLKRGQSVLLHRHLIHGVAPWAGQGAERAIAYFRPLTTPQVWLAPDNR